MSETACTTSTADLCAGLASSDLWALGGMACGALALGLATWALIREFRSSPVVVEVQDAPEPETTDQTEALAPPTCFATYSVSAEHNGRIFTLTSDEPLTLDDLQNARMILCRAYGPVVGVAWAQRLYTELLQAEAADLDGELVALLAGGA